MEAEQFTHRGIPCIIEYDEYSESPKEWADESVFLIAAHREFYVEFPDKTKPTPAAVEEWRSAGTHWIFPIEAYIHSGICLSFSSEGNFPDRRWDVSNPVGFIFVEKKWTRLRKSARKAAAALLNVWNQYLSGDVYCVQVGDERYGSVYGIEEARASAEDEAEGQYRHALRAHIEKRKAQIKKAVPINYRKAFSV